MKQVPVGQLAEEGEYHAMLDSAENFDADTVAEATTSTTLLGWTRVSPSCS